MTPALKQKLYRERKALASTNVQKRVSAKKLVKGKEAADEKLGSTVEECEELAARLKKQSLDADDDPACAWPVRASLKQSLVRTLAQLARLRGEGEASESTVARSAPFRRTRDAIIDALRPFPDALRAVRDALAELEAGK